MVLPKLRLLSWNTGTGTYLFQFLRISKLTTLFQPTDIIELPDLPPRHVVEPASCRKVFMMAQLEEIR